MGVRQGCIEKGRKGEEEIYDSPDDAINIEDEQ